jgi:hypothetical protein
VHGRGLATSQQAAAGSGGLRRVCNMSTSGPSASSRVAKGTSRSRQAAAALLLYYIIGSLERGV